MSHSKLTIIGSGPAGYTAALYAARQLAAKIDYGSCEGWAADDDDDVDNWPADAHSVQGPELMKRFFDHAERFGTDMVTDEIASVEFRTR